MQFHANHVSASADGDYYQVLFEAVEDSTDPESPYLPSANSKIQMAVTGVSRPTSGTSAYAESTCQSPESCLKLIDRKTMSWK
jgi:hypothetical protein